MSHMYHLFSNTYIYVFLNLKITLGVFSECKEHICSPLLKRVLESSKMTTRGLWVSRGNPKGA